MLNQMTSQGETEPTDSEQAAQQASEDQIDLSASQEQPGRAGSTPDRIAPGRKPLFRS